jgi:mannose-6-phosphate isomerase
MGVTPMDPLVFEPYLRPQIWGGRRLEPYLGRPLPSDGPFGEAWVLSDQALHVSRVAEGPLEGMPLGELWASRSGELVGPRRPAPARFPLLLKYLDCEKQLSVQVHPSDELVRRLEVDESGKTETWVVIEASPDARVYAGLRPGTTRGDLERHLDAGTVAECLHSFVPERGQCVFLPAGTVHAAGGGLLVAEIQQSSDATYRLFDWNRLGPDGKPRPLHRQEALLSIDWSAGPIAPTSGCAAVELPGGNRSERLVACRYFSIDRFQVAAPLEMRYLDRLSVWMLLEGSAVLSSGETGYRRDFRTGETVLIPAATGSLQWSPFAVGQPATLLGVLMP